MVDVHGEQLKVSNFGRFMLRCEVKHCPLSAPQSLALTFQHLIFWDEMVLQPMVYLDPVQKMSIIDHVFVVKFDCHYHSGHSEKCANSYWKPHLISDPSSSTFYHSFSSIQTTNFKYPTRLSNIRILTTFLYRLLGLLHFIHLILQMRDCFLLTIHQLS